MTNTQSIALNRLVQSKANVRRTGQTTGLEPLMASIAAHGLRQNLNVLPTTGGRFEVIAGGRRLIALKKLARAGTIPADLPVPCLVLTEADNATEISLAENQVREAMHPDDQCGAFQTLLAEGLPVEDIAARFGVTPAVVTQRLRLAAVSPKLRALYRAGDTTLAHMMALTLSEDHVAQERALAEGGSPGGIRRYLSQDSIRADHRLALFVGLDAYRAAGGTVLDDLFEPSECYLTDPALLTTLASAQLRDAAALLVAEGWSWVLPQLERDWSTAYRRVHGEEQEDGSVLFTPEQRAQAGVRLTLNHAGAVEVDRGLVRMDESRRVAGTTAENDEARPARPDYPAMLVTELTAHQTAAIQMELTQRPDLALAVVVHGFLVRHRTTHGQQSCLALTLRVPELARHVTDTADCPAHQALKDQLNGWNTQLPADPARLWDWCLAQPQETLLSVLATYAALSVDTVRGPYPSDDNPAVVHAHALMQALDFNMADHWQPTPAFMGRVSKTVMAAALTEMGQEAVAADLAVMKKPAAAAKVAQALAGTGWLPPVLRRRKAAAVNDNAQVAPWEDGAAEPIEEAA